MKKSTALNAPFQPASFAFRDVTKVREIIARYPKGRDQSAIMPLLDLAQRQVGEDGLKSAKPYGGWIPRAAMDEVAKLCGVAPMKVYEVATFYSMYNLEPVGKYLLQFCTTTPCWLCNASGVLQAAEKHLGIHVGDTTDDGYFTIMEVECLGACSNAPMVQINDHYYEDLTPEKMVEILKSFRQDVIPPSGPQNGRKGSMSIAGPTSLMDQAKKAGVI
ncbi:MAG: NADH-quinone oxidoreductase subunit NuoE [Alphaproteobacteria bacterium]|nr:NADH-quinone oxidoreductase subunit NuoE [Alphaproteobacteria bacterium]